MFKPTVRTLMICIVAGLGALQTAAAQTAILRTATVSAGTGSSASSAYVLRSTLGEPANGRLANNAFSAYTGFWNQVYPPAGPIARPTASDDDDATDEDVALSLDVLANDVDPGGGALSITAFSQPAHGAVEQVGTDTLVYTPEADYHGPDAFTYTVTNPLGGSATATVTLTIHPVNDAPVFTSMPLTGVAADAAYAYTAEAADVDGDAVTLTAPTLPDWLTFTDQGDGTGTLRGTPTNADVGEHAVALQTTDGIATTEQAFTLTVPAGAPGLPTLAAPRNNAADVATSAPLTWTRAPGASTYDVEVATRDDFAATLIDTTGLADTTFTASNLMNGTTYFWRVRAVNSAGASPYTPPFRFTTATNVALEEADAVPDRFALMPNYPNPFNPTTTIAYTLPVQAEVRLGVYDLFGRAVATLVQRTQAAGRYEVRFEARDLASGLYFYRLEADSFSQTRQLMLLK